MGAQFSSLNSAQSRVALRLLRAISTEAHTSFSAVSGVTMPLTEAIEKLNKYSVNFPYPLRECMAQAALEDRNILVCERFIFGTTYPFHILFKRLGGYWHSETPRGWAFPSSEVAQDAYRQALSQPQPDAPTPRRKRKHGQAPMPAPQPDEFGQINPQLIIRKVEQIPQPQPQEPQPMPAPQPQAPQEIPQDAQALLAQLAQILARPAAPAVDPAILRQIQDRLEVLEAQGGQAPLKIQILRENLPPQDLEGVHHRQLPALIALAQDFRARSIPDPICLVGPAGTGKTHAARALADALKLSFYSTSIGPATMESRLLGYMDATGQLVRTPIREAVEHGGVCLIDEFDAGSPQALLVLNAITANSHIGFPDRTIARHPDLIVIFAANTYGRGAQDGYKRSSQDRALLDRIAWLDWPVDPTLELSMAGGDNATVQYINDVRRELKQAGADVYLSPRATRRFAALVASGRSAEEAREISFGYAGMDAPTQAVINRVQLPRY